MRKEYAKKEIAKTFKELCKTKSINKISINEICTACGLNKSTFYYHFLDKDDLIKWIFDQEIVSQYQIALPGQWINNTSHLIEVFHEESHFYQQTLSVDSKNNIRKYLYESTYIKTMEFIRAYLGKRELGQGQIDFIADFYTSAFVETHLNYLKSGAKEEPHIIMEWYYTITEESLKIAIEQFIKRNSQKNKTHN